MNPSAGIQHDLLLVGGGHAHIQILSAWAMDPVPGARLTVVVDRPVAIYSGMIPGFVAGQYRADELEIDVRPPLAYDTISFDVGSTVAGLDRPGVREHAIPTRPIGSFVRAVDGLIARARGRRGFRLVVAGAGAGGVELAFTFRARLAREGLA